MVCTKINHVGLFVAVRRALSLVRDYNLLFRHLLAHLPNNLAQKVLDLAKKKSGEQKKNALWCHARLREKAHPLKTLGSVASYLENPRRIYNK